MTEQKAFTDVKVIICCMVMKSLFARTEDGQEIQDVSVRDYSSLPTLLKKVVV